MRKPQLNQSRSVEAYIILLHLVSAKKARFVEIQTLLFWDEWKMAEAIRVVAHINHRLLELSEEWNEGIPRINAFLFNRNGMCTDYVCEEVFKLAEGEQPTPMQIAEYAEAIHAYPKWDKVLDVFRQEAFGY